MEKRAEILDLAAARLDVGTAQYGTPEDSFGKIATLWNAYLDASLTPRDVAMMMILLKIARMAAAGTTDTLVDIAGYAACAAALGEEA